MGAAILQLLWIRNVQVRNMLVRNVRVQNERSNEGRDWRFYPLLSSMAPGSPIPFALLIPLLS